MSDWLVPLPIAAAAARRRRCRSSSGGRRLACSGSSASSCSPRSIVDLDRAARRRRPRRRRSSTQVGRLAGAARHHARRRPASPRSCSCVASLMLLAVLVYAIGQPGAERNHVGFQSVYLVLAAGVARVVPHRRPVQPVRRVRDDAHRELRAAHPRRPPRAGARRHDLRGHQPARRRRCSSPRSRCVYSATGTRQHGRPRGQDRRPPRRRAHGVRRAARSSCSASRPALFPLFFWLPDSYPTAPSPVTAVFAGLLTKVGVYAIIRTQTLLFPPDSRPATLLLVARRPHDGGRRARRHRPGRRQADPVVPHRQPDRLHGDGPRLVHRRRPRRGDLLHRPPHRREDHAVPRRRARSSTSAGPAGSLGVGGHGPHRARARRAVPRSRR